MRSNVCGGKARIAPPGCSYTRHDAVIIDADVKCSSFSVCQSNDGLNHNLVRQAAFRITLEFDR